MRTYWNHEDAAEGLEWYHTCGNVSFVCNCTETAKLVNDWADGHDRFYPPMSIDDVGNTKEFEAFLIEMREKKAEETAWAVHPAEMQESQDEEASVGIETFDDVTTEEDEGGQSRDMMAQEEGLLEEVPLPGLTSGEKARKDAWLRLPRAGRAAIRRMHQQFGHVPKGPFIAI